MATTVCELLYIISVLRDLQVLINYPVQLYCDNKVAIQIAANPIFHERTKHIDIDCHIMRE